MTAKKPLGLFQGFGVELEYMIVKDADLSVLPVADRVLTLQAGELVDEVEVGPLAWSNELVMHVIELKTNGPANSLQGLAATFQDHVERINGLLKKAGGRLMPGGMHPWMDPFNETCLWPYGNRTIYETYDRIFGCRGHGWSNLQSVHINLPFADDAEFARLHAAIRLVLPLLPALAASSPLLDGQSNGFLDNRLEVYRLNQRLIPSITGQVIPEPVFSRESYEEVILERMYADVASRDPERILQEEWLNSRGAIARFDRNTIEIRLLDIQECPLADLTIVSLVVALLRALVEERLAPLTEQQLWAVTPLEQLLLQTIRHGEAALIEDAGYLRLFNHSGDKATAGELWQHIVSEIQFDSRPDYAEFRPALAVLFSQGTLARRLLRALGDQPGRSRQAQVYRQLCDCLAHGELFCG